MYIKTGTNKQVIFILANMYTGIISQKQTASLNA